MILWISSILNRIGMKMVYPVVYGSVAFSLHKLFLLVFSKIMHENIQFPLIYSLLTTKLWTIKSQAKHLMMVFVFPSSLK